jgi:hypothetical protein
MPPSFKLLPLPLNLGEGDKGDRVNAFEDIKNRKLSPIFLN